MVFVDLEYVGPRKGFTICLSPWLSQMHDDHNRKGINTDVFCLSCAFCFACQVYLFTFRACKLRTSGDAERNARQSRLHETSACKWCAVFTSCVLQSFVPRTAIGPSRKNMGSEESLAISSTCWTRMIQAKLWVTRATSAWNPEFCGGFITLVELEERMEAVNVCQADFRCQFLMLWVWGSWREDVFRSFRT